MLFLPDKSHGKVIEKKSYCRASSANQKLDFLQRCIYLASQADSRVYPNPRVGSVVVYNGHIIGEGYHAYAGGPHAEVVAIRSVRNPELLKSCTLYVSLEPCSHYGKTPPCAHLIVEKGIPHVVIGCKDPNPLVSGKGIEYLRSHGVRVEISPDEAPFIALNAVFFINQQQKRPFITLKWAESADGFVGGLRPDGQPARAMISGREAKTWVHRLRAHNHSILIGRRTALYDDPLLTVRNYPGRHPLRLVLDPDLSLPGDVNMLRDGLPTILINRKEAREEGSLRLCKTDAMDSPAELGKFLFDHCGVCSIMVEGGPSTLQPFIESGAFDVAYRIISPKVLDRGVAAPVITGRHSLVDEQSLGSDLLQVYHPLAQA
jgi:diaminohydroxyphosphoribosylaminopyrimidine deaminase/5-amino-6-(5-phosphoribosylamino)uracil reductase